MDVVAIVYNKDGEALDASMSRLVDPIYRNGSKEVFFTWPLPFTESVARSEIIPRINPFSLIPN